MKNEKIIFEKNNYRILEVLDEHADIENLKGDCFKPEVNKYRDAELLKNEEIEFERKVERDGVYGFVLEVWNPSIGVGWEHVDSCWGFVGTHEIENHYIVDEFKGQIK